MAKSLSFPRHAAGGMGTTAMVYHLLPTPYSWKTTLIEESEE